MATTRISSEARQALKEIARKRGTTMQATLDEAVEVYRRKVFLDDCNKAYAALRQNQELWIDERNERAAWDSALADDIGEN